MGRGVRSETNQWKQYLLRADTLYGQNLDHQLG